MLVDGLNEWTVEDILDSKKPRGGPLVPRFDGKAMIRTCLGDRADSGEFDKAKDIVEEFHKEYPRKPR